MKARLIVLILVFIIIIVSIYERDLKYQEPTAPNKSSEASLNNTYVILLSGINSHCDGTPYNQMGFSYLRRQFSQIGVSYRDAHFLKYSYNGGKIRNGRWYPNPYTSEDTGQPIEFSILHLKEMIDEITQHNRGTRFLLVGHSLGGRIAFDYVTKYHLEKPGPIKGVITLNSPLLGSPYVRTDILSKIRPIWGSIAVKQLSAEYQLRNELDISKLRKDAACKLLKKGVHLATFATKQDVIVDPLTACLLDVQERPLTEGNIISVNMLSGSFNELFGHVQILEQKEVADYIISVYNCFCCRSEQRKQPR